MFQSMPDGHLCSNLCLMGIYVGQTCASMFQSMPDGHLCWANLGICVPIFGDFRPSLHVCWVLDSWLPQYMSGPACTGIQVCCYYCLVYRFTGIHYYWYRYHYYSTGIPAPTVYLAGLKSNIKMFMGNKKKT